MPTVDRFQEVIYKKVEVYNLHHSIEIINFDNSFEKIIASKVAICCSGTATLQLSLLSIPTIVIYKTSFFNAVFGRLLVNINNVVLPNFIAGKQILPFLFQEKFNSEDLFKLFCEFYDNYKFYRHKCQKLSKDLKNEIIRDKNGFNYNLTKKILNILS